MERKRENRYLQLVALTSIVHLGLIITEKECLGAPNALFFGPGAKATQLAAIPLFKALLVVITLLITNLFKISQRNNYEGVKVSLKVRPVLSPQVLKVLLTVIPPNELFSIAKEEPGERRQPIYKDRASLAVEAASMI
ncbi:hypothetical protein NE237_015769 [Protea cynaroides]|uniref:Uncharacterized protein n=1 Tax=Protea cynaroides TaxID=273540 RepID=A0A9Q0KEF7_9MAGN|nr:hypothetical protein NE237_015769 [Protea cynaroides]